MLQAQQGGGGAMPYQTLEGEGDHRNALRLKAQVLFEVILSSRMFDRVGFNVLSTFAHVWAFASAERLLFSLSDCYSEAPRWTSYGCLYLKVLEAIAILECCQQMSPDTTGKY